jgi:hypothetical protein
VVIWRGFGILVPIIVGFMFVLTQYLVNLALKNPDYYRWHYWPKALATLLAAIAVWYVGRYFNGRPGKVVIDNATGREIVRRKIHDLFFVRFEYWAFVLLAFIVIGYFV